MAITYNNLYLDIRQQLRRAGIETALVSLEGDMVEEDQVLYQVDSGDLSTAIERAEAAGRFPGWLPPAAGMLAGTVFLAALDALELSLIPATLQHEIPSFAVGHDLTPAIVIPQAGHETLAQLPAVAVLQNIRILCHMVPFQNSHDLIAADLHIGAQRLQDLSPGVGREPRSGLVSLLHRSRPFRWAAFDWPGGVSKMGGSVPKTYRSPCRSACPAS